MPEISREKATGLCAWVLLCVVVFGVIAMTARAWDNFLVPVFIITSIFVVGLAFFYCIERGTTNNEMYDIDEEIGSYDTNANVRVNANEGVSAIPEISSIESSPKVINISLPPTIHIQDGIRKERP